MAPVPLMRKENDTFVFEYQLLKNLLSDPDLKDLPLAIISIAGKFRLGKSFLISHAVAKLKGIEVNNNNDYFKFKKSSARQTEGIDVWPEPFVVKRTDGSKVVVLFMDTQGTFDCETSFRENNLIFGVSATMSSLLMYNLMRQIDTSDMENLAYFVNFGLAAQKSSGHKVYQDIIYVIRDWTNTNDNPYGFDGGQEMLEKHHRNSHDTVKGLHDNIIKSFKSRKCFLCPPPGDNVHSDNFTGNLKELDQDFQTHFQTLIDTVLDKDSIQAKMFNGKPLLCKDAPSVMNIMFESLVKAPEPKDLLELTGKSTHEAAKQLAFNYFNEKTTELEEQLADLSIDQSEAFLRQAAKSAVELFKETPRMGHDLFENEFERELIESMIKRGSEVHLSHLTILKTQALESDNAELARQYAEMEEQCENERQKNETRSQQINEMKERHQLMYETLNTQLKTIKANHEEQTKQLTEQMEKDRELFEQKKVELENELRKHVKITEKHIADMERQKRKMDEEFDKIEKENEKKLAKLHKEYEQMKEDLEEKARVREENFGIKLETMIDSEKIAQTERETARKQAEEKREQEAKVYKIQLETKRAEKEEARKTEIEKLEKIKREKEKSGCSIM